MSWSNRKRYDSSPSAFPILKLRDEPFVLPEVEVDLAFDAAIVDSLIRGLPLGLITVLRAHDGQRLIEVVVDGARRMHAIRRHLSGDPGGLFLDFRECAVVTSCEGRLDTWPSSVLVDRKALWDAQRTLGRGPMANRLEHASNAVVEGVVLVQIFDDVAMLARRLGHEDRAAWLAEVTAKATAQAKPGTISTSSRGFAGS